MEVIHADANQIDSILMVLDRARTIMRETGNLTQWTNGYPSVETILDDIRRGNGFVILHDKEIIGYFCLIVGDDPDPNYREIENGNWLDDLPYGVIHRLASGRRAKGVAQIAFDYAFSIIGNIRVDTHRDNIPMRRFLEKNDFKYCGVIYVDDGTPRDAFQKQLSP